MEKYLASLPIDIYIHIYDGDRDFIEHRDIDEMKAWLRHEPRALAFEEVWADLEESIRLNGALRGVRASFSESEASLLFSLGDAILELPQEDVLALWQQLRSFGLLSIDDIPSVYQSVAEQLLSLLERLPYVDRAEFISLGDLKSARRETVSDGLDHVTSRGVRLVIWESEPFVPEQLSLFDQRSVA